ncbi:hypothetical protein V8C26DRAFT_390613 [Trichoderma gracile]
MDRLGLVASMVLVRAGRLEPVPLSVLLSQRVLVPCPALWPPYLRMSGRYTCVLDTCANVSLLCDSHVAARQSHRPSLAAVRREPAPQRLRCLL